MKKASQRSDSGPQRAVTQHRIGGFTLIEKIGQGAMGAVFKARQEAFGRLVALKILPQSLARNPAFLERFLREARAAARLSDPNIVQAIDAGEANGYYYFAMELVDGQSLAALLARQTRLPERRALEITRDLARALQHAHREGIIHRDVKPANILLGNDGTTKLADLGLARETQQTKSDVTHAGDTMGTPDYISPEQIRGDRELDGRADIYSLGATLYHMLTGTSPFLGGNSAQVMTRHLTEPIPDPRSAVPELSPACSQIVRKAMQKERERRYATAGDMLKDVEAALAGEGVSGGGLRPFVPTRGQTTTRLMGMASPAGRTVGRPTQAMRKAARSRKSPTATIVATVATVTAVLVLVFIAIFGFPGDEASPSNGSSGFPTDTVKPEIAQLISEQDFAGALKRVAELRLAHPDEIEFLRGLERDVLYEVHAFYQSALQKAQFEATKGNYEEAIAVLRPVLGFGIPDLKLAAEAKIVEMEQKQTEKRVKEQWQSIREQVADALASGQFAEARAILDEAKGLALAGMADLVEREKDRVDAAEAEEHQRRLANYDRESDRFWGLLKERQYAEAQRLINTLHKNAAYRDIAARVQADVRAVARLHEFWSAVESGVSKRRGEFISIGGVGGILKEVKDGVVTVSVDGREEQRSLRAFTAGQALAYARLDTRAALRPAIGVFLIAEQENPAEAERMLADDEDRPDIRFYLERLRKLKPVE